MSKNEKHEELKRAGFDLGHNDQFGDTLLRDKENMGKAHSKVDKINILLDSLEASVLAAIERGATKEEMLAMVKTWQTNRHHAIAEIEKGH